MTFDIITFNRDSRRNIDWVVSINGEPRAMFASQKPHGAGYHLMATEDDGIMRPVATRFSGRLISQAVFGRVVRQNIDRLPTMEQINTWATKRRELYAKFAAEKAERDRLHRVKCDMMVEAMKLYIEKKQMGKNEYLDPEHVAAAQQVLADYQSGDDPVVT